MLASPFEVEVAGISQRRLRNPRQGSISTTLRNLYMKYGRGVIFVQVLIHSAIQACNQRRQFADMRDDMYACRDGARRALALDVDPGGLHAQARGRQGIFLP